MTPGHPEFPSSEHNTPGIECTTGPLGQGVSNAVGMAAAQKSAAAWFNTDSQKIFDSHIIALAGDGCIQEGASLTGTRTLDDVLQRVVTWTWCGVCSSGVAAESAAFAAHEKLDNLIIMYDANDVTLDDMADKTQSEDVGARYRAYGWDVEQIDGHDLEAIEKAVTKAKNTDNGKPKLIICKTIIGKGIDEVAGTNAGE
jgi:transketolase